LNCLVWLVRLARLEKDFWSVEFGSQWLCSRSPVFRDLNVCSRLASLAVHLMDEFGRPLHPRGIADLVLHTRPLTKKTKNKNTHTHIQQTLSLQLAVSTKHFK